MELSPERRAYAEKRVKRLDDKIAFAERVISDQTTETETRLFLQRQRRSSLNARKRWLKELGQ